MCNVRKLYRVTIDKGAIHVTQPLLKGMEGVFIPVKDPQRSAEWYEEKLGFTLVYMEDEAAVMKIAAESQTVVCLVKIVHHQPMKFPENNFDVGKYYNFIPRDIAETYQTLVEQGVQVTPMGGEGSTRYFTFYDPDGNPLGVCQ
jgi:glyoxylase I family protein